MAQFDLHAGDAEGVAYLLDCQSDIIERFETRLIVPLYRVGSRRAPTRRLQPVFEIDGRDVVMATHLAAAVPIADLRKKIGSLDHERDRIVDALYMLITGF